MGEPTAVTLAAAALGWLLLGVLPGWLVVSAVTPERSALDRLAVAPAVSLGLAYPAAAWANRLGIAVALPAALAALVLASTVSATVLLRRRRAGEPGPLLDRTTLTAVRVPVLLVVLLWLTAMATSVAGWGLVAPNSDGNSHGLAVVALLQHGEVLGSGGYPLGVHVVAALVGSATSVPSALVVPLTLLGSVWAVLGVAALAGRVSPSLVPWVAFAACAVPYFPFGQVNWGPVPLVLAVALVPGVALAVLDAVGRGPLAVAAMSVAGLLAAHVTEALVAGLLVLLVLVLTRTALVPRLARATAVGLGALLLTAPLVAELLAGGASRPTDTGVGAPEAGTALGVGSRDERRSSRGSRRCGRSDALGRRRSRGWRCSSPCRWWAPDARGPRPHGRAVVLLVVLLVGLAVLARVTSGGLLTSPWYGNGDRLVAQASALLPVLLGAGFERLLLRYRHGGAATVAAVVVGLCAFAAVVQGVAVAQQGLGRFSVVTPDDRLAFAWLASHVQPGEHVLNDHRDGSVWMVEETSGVDQPLFGGKPGGGFEAYPEWADRVYLRDHVADYATDARVRSIAARWDVRYVFSGERTFADAPRLVDVDALAAAPGVVEVFRSGDARVFQLPRP